MKVWYGIVKRSVSALLSVSVATVSMWGADAPVFGTVVFAERAHVGQAGVSAGTTLFSGDVLNTEEAGGAQVRAGAARLQLAPVSRVAWGSESGTPAATLMAGTATFSTAKSRAFVLRMATATVRAKSDEPTIGSVTYVNARELNVSCTRGTLVFAVDDDTMEVASGSAYHVILDPDMGMPAPGKDPANAWGSQKPKKSGKNKFIFFWLFGGAAVAGAVGVILALESADKP